MDLDPRTFGRLAPLALAATLAACGAAVAEEAERIAALMAVARGGVVADVGAGDGEWTVELAAQVGPSGRVYATEVDDAEIEAIHERLAAAGLDNVAVVRGDQSDTGLPAACCEAVLLRMVYHHFTEPPAMRASLARALRPGGRLVVIDIDPQRHWRELEGVPERGGHGIALAQLVAEMEGAGFETIETIREWNGDADRYCVVFRRAGT